MELDAQSAQIAGLDNQKIVPASPKLVRQASEKRSGSASEYGSTKSSIEQSLGFDHMENGSKRCYKYNSFAFGHGVGTDNDDGLEAQFLSDTEKQKGSNLPMDLESAEQCSQDANLQVSKSVMEEDMQITTGGLQKQQNATTTKGLGSKSGNKSRLETIILEQSSFTVYKRLHVATIIINLLLLVLASYDLLPYAKSNVVIFSLGNIGMCVLVRNEVFLRIVFWLAVKLMGHSWVPVKLKTMTTAMLQSLGGIHSGCGLAAMIWLAYAIGQSFRNRQTASPALLGLALGILCLLFLSSLAAFPVLRHIHHNIFERMHRFAGWTSLGLVWAYVVLDTFWDPVTKSYRIWSRSGTELVHMEALWLTLVTTFMIILPWLSMRKVAVEAVVPPTKLNTLLHFEGGVKAGLLARISPSPFSEWHAFGIISDGRKTHTILAGAVGDFTKSLVERPPTHIWVRTLHFAGLPYLTNLYQRALLVATGSGIGVFMSFLLQQGKADVHLIWITKNIRESYGDGIWRAFNDAHPAKITVVDTAVSGRPKMRELVVTKAKEWRAEVVIVTSNPSGTNDILNGCKAAGIPAYGPIWDS